MKNNFCYSNYTIIDIETTGLSTTYDSIIEISAVKVRNETIVGEFSELVYCDLQLNDFIVELTGITNELLKNADKVDSVIYRFNEFIATDILIGHNIAFDLNFIKAKQNKSLENYRVDTLGLSRRVLKDVDNHKLSTIANHFNIERTIHRGLEDCIVTYKVYENLKKLIKENNLNFDLMRNNRVNEYQKKLNEIQSNQEVNEYIQDNFFFEKNVVVTGKMEKYSKFELGQLIVNNGGNFSDSINKHTNVLILGNQDYQAAIFGNKSSKYLKALDLIKQGAELIILDEKTALDLLNKSL